MCTIFHSNEVFMTCFISLTMQSKSWVLLQKQHSYERGEGVEGYGNPILYNLFSEFSVTKCWETNCCYIFHSNMEGKSEVYAVFAQRQETIEF